MKHLKLFEDFSQDNYSEELYSKFLSWLSSKDFELYDGEQSLREKFIEISEDDNIEVPEKAEAITEFLENGWGLYDGYMEVCDYLESLFNGELDGSDYEDDFEGLDESKKSGVTASLKKKSKASGIPMGILRKVFSKGMQAWNSGHRPGVAQHQWGMGRVNSFITGAGGARKADADLWSKAKAAKARKKKK